MSNFWQRTITGLLYVLVLVASIYFGSISFASMLFIASLFCSLEYFNLLKKKFPSIHVLLGVFLNQVTYLSLSFYFLYGVSAALFLLPALFLVPILSVLFKEKDTEAFSRISFYFTSLFWIAIPLGALNILGTVGNFFDIGLVLFVISLFWISDTFAYLSGKLMGKRPLIARISPGKTKEGALGGLLCTLAFAAFVGPAISVHLDVISALSLAGIVFVFGLLGDLIESQFKRWMGVKDSGTLLPGHGGFLDRFDSILGASPVILLYISLYF